MGELQSSMLSAADHFSGDAVDAVQKATSDPNLFHFKELLDLDAVQQLGASNPTFQFLEVFCYKKYADYQATSGLPQLSDSQLEKLRLLTLVSLCADQKIVSYETLKEELQISCVRELVAWKAHSETIIAQMDGEVEEGKKLH